MDTEKMAMLENAFILIGAELMGPEIIENLKNVGRSRHINLRPIEPEETKLDIEVKEVERAFYWFGDLLRKYASHMLTCKAIEPGLSLEEHFKRVERLAKVVGTVGDLFWLLVRYGHPSLPDGIGLRSDWSLVKTVPQENPVESLLKHLLGGGGNDVPD